MSQVRAEIPASDFEVLGRVYCQHCGFEHWVDIRRINLDDEITLLFEFDHDNRGNFFWGRAKEIKRRFLKRKPLEKTVDIVAMDWWQFNEVFNLLGGPQKKDFKDLDFPKINWSKDPGVKFGDAMIFESESLFLSIEVVSKKEKCYLYDVNLGWKLPHFSLKDHLRHLKRFLFNNYDMFFYNYEAAISKEQEEELLSAIKLINDIIVFDEKGEMLFKTPPPNMPEEEQ